MNEWICQSIVTVNQSESESNKFNLPGIKSNSTVNGFPLVSTHVSCSGSQTSTLIPFTWPLPLRETLLLIRWTMVKIEREREKI